MDAITQTGSAVNQSIVNSLAKAGEEQFKGMVEELGSVVKVILTLQLAEHFVPREVEALSKTECIDKDFTTNEDIFTFTVQNAADSLEYTFFMEIFHSCKVPERVAAFISKDNACRVFLNLTVESQTDRMKISISKKLCTIAHPIPYEKI